MSIQKKKLYLRIKKHIRKQLISGILLLIPLGITLFAIKFLLSITAGTLVPVIKKLLIGIPNFFLVILSVSIFLLIIYFLGFITTFFVGRRLLSVGESFIMKLPLLNTVYGASKKIVNAFALADKSNFKSVVFIDFPRIGVKSIGFITNTVEDEKKQKCYIIVVPTAPNPTSGFIQIIPCNQVMETSLSVEEGIKMIVSGGILSPDQLSTIIGKTAFNQIDTLADSNLDKDHF